MTVIRVAHVSKCFQLEPERPRSFQDLAISLFRHQRYRGEQFWALRDISFEVENGETLGIIGANGSGKSTCLKLLTGIIESTSGTIDVQGRVSALLELGAGFHPELTGRENVFLNGAVLGMRRRDMARRFDGIVAFAELERFIDVPVKFYSSGMYVRLAFATAISVDPDVMLVDEVLAVGDQSFQEKCMERIHELQAKGVTIVFVSHSLDAVRGLCSRTIWLDEGILREDGPTDLVVTDYLQHVHTKEEVESLKQRDQERASLQAAPTVPEKSKIGHTGETLSTTGNEGALHRFRQRWGTREAEIINVRLLSRTGKETLALTTGEPVTVVIHYRASQRIEDPVFGVAIYRDDGLHMGGSNTFLAHFPIPSIEGEGEVHYTIDRLPLLEGTFYLSVAIHDADQVRTYDYHELYYRFRVYIGAIQERYGMVFMPSRWEHMRNESMPEGT